MTYIRYLRGLLVFCGLFVLLLAINVIQTVCLPLLLFGKGPFVRFNIFLKYFFGNAAAAGSRICGNTLTITGDAMQKESAIIIANHQSFLDIPIIWMLTASNGMAGWINWFAKDSLKYIPGVGLGLKFSQAILLKRNWSKDSESIKATFKTLLEADAPFLATIFPEGTRMKPSKFAASKEYSLRKGAHSYSRVLVPRPKGVWATCQGLNSKLGAIYDIHIGYPTLPPPPLRYFTEGNYNVKLHIRRFPKSALPTSERSFNEWIQARFIEKDEWMSHHSGYTPQ